MKNLQSIKNPLIAFFLALVLVSCEEELVVQPSRLFMPVLSKELKAEFNTIIVQIAKSKQADGYTLEVSRDTFKTIDYTLRIDTNYVVLNEETLNGDPLFWNTLYQIRAKTHAKDPQYDSKVSDLGNVRTERFPSVQKVPASNDVIDRAAKVKWTVSGLPITKIVVFAGSDLKLSKPLREIQLTAAQQATGEAVISNLEAETKYQLAIYSGATLRGWENYQTLPSAIDYNDPRVINLSESTDPDALSAAIATASDGSIIVLKKGVSYNTPTTPLDKSITIRGAYGFESKKATLVNCNWNIANGAQLDHVRFVDVEIVGAGIAGAYIFNPSPSVLTTIKDFVLDDCIVSEVRGVIRIRSLAFVTNFTIKNSIIHRVGNYGVITTDTDGENRATMQNVVFENSTFSKINMLITSRQNMKSVKIDGCTMSEVGVTNGVIFNWRGTKGVRSNVEEGISISNTVWGHGWDEAGTQTFAVRGIAGGLEATNISILNTYATSDFAFVAGSEIPTFPSTVYTKKAVDLWESPYTGLNFNFKDGSFVGRRDVGDPRWRVK